MLLSELLQSFSLGPVSNLAMSGEGSGTIRDKDLPKIIGYVNTGLLKLYGRFVLSTDDVMVNQVEHITKYVLQPRYAQSSNSNEVHKYIIDTGDKPFLNNVIKIMEVFDSLGRKVPLNDPGNPVSYFTPVPDTLQVNYPIPNVGINITYQSRHPELKLEGDGVLDQEVEIPVYLKLALMSHMAYSVYSHMNGQEHAAKAQEHIALFEAECTEIEDNDLANMSQSNTTYKLEERGFR